MFRRKSDPMQASADVQRITQGGGTASLSYSQVILLIVNSEDAKKNLTEKEYFAFQQIVLAFRQQTKCIKVDSAGYYKMCFTIITECERYFPYMLVDGNHSSNLEFYQELQIRKLHSEGLSFEDAMWKYEKENDRIEPYEEYDPINKPHEKHIATEMIQFALKIWRRHKTVLFYSEIGTFLGYADVIYRMLGKSYVPNITNEAQIIKDYIRIALAAHYIGDSDIRWTFNYMKDTSDELYEENAEKDNNELLSSIEDHYEIIHEINYDSDDDELSADCKAFHDALTTFNAHLSTYVILQI